MPPKKDEVPDWLRLQRRIFSRWCHQKLSLSRNIQVEDIVTEIGDGLLLIALMEVLAEKKFTEKMDQKPKMRVQKIDNLNRALKFVFEDCAVVMKLKPSANDLADGDEKRILGLIWSIMLKYMRFGDDSESLNAKEALLLWCQNKTNGYAHINLENWKKSFDDGLALCAIIHRHRPKLIDYNSLSPSDALGNIAKAQDAAERYFGLEKYLTPEDFLKLDESSRVVYVSEYFYGIAEQRKVDLAVRRVKKLVTFTEVNDAMRDEYCKDSLTLQEHMQKVETMLSDRTIDNTMAGAKKRIADFYVYKAEDKGQILGEKLQLESLFNNLAMRLSEGKRPEYQPPAGRRLEDVDAALHHLEECESERKVALHKELNRQISLLREDEQHKASFAKLKAWVAQKTDYLNTKEQISSVGAAIFELSRLDAADSEISAVHGGAIADLKKSGDHLEAEKYESLSGTRARESELDADVDTLRSLSTKKRPVLDDDLARELFRDDLRLQNQQHSRDHDEVIEWVKEKEAYLLTKEQISSVEQALTQLALLEAYEAEKQSMTDSMVAQLKELGAAVTSARYETEYSKAQFETPDEIAQREQAVDAAWDQLSTLSAAKKEVLDDDLAREQFRANLRILNASHINKNDRLVAWIGDQETYLKTKETVTSVTIAETQLGLLDAYEKEKTSQLATGVASLKALGQEILTAKYETKHSSAVWETPDEINARESAIDGKFVELDALSAAKREVLDDDLAREQFSDKLRRLNSNHLSQYERLQVWIAAKETYLNTREEIDTVSEAQVQIKLLAAYEKQKETRTNTNVAQLNKLGEEVRSARYETKHSKAQFETPEELTTREAAITDKWASLSTLSATKSEWLAAELAREKKKEELRVSFANSAGNFERWVKDADEKTQTTEFGFTLAEVEAFKANLDSDDARLGTEADAHVSACNAIFNEAKDLGVRENVYTKHNPDTLQGVRGELAAALAKRQERYAAELAVQQANDALCKSFADVADPFAAWIGETKDKITKSKDELDAQLAYVNERLASVDADGAPLADIERLQGEIDGKNITNNVHTLATAKDVQVQWAQYKAFLTKKQTMLAEAIEAAKLKGITPEQFKEIEENFTQFDKNNNGVLSTREFRACLFSLGEEKGAQEIQKLYDQYATPEKEGIEYESFKAFMISVLGDADTKDEILAGFKLINRGDIATHDKMEACMDDHEREYIERTAPAVEGGWNYNAWVEDVYSR